MSTQVKDTRRSTGGLDPLGYEIFLDRYAMKAVIDRTIDPGDTVVIFAGPGASGRRSGTVTARNDSTVVVELRDGTLVHQAIEHVDKPLETHPAQMVERVARGIAEIETKPEKRSEWQGKFEWLLSDWRFIPGGRILAAAGTDQNLTFYNCYVIPSPKDSLKGVLNTFSRMMEIMSRGGGVGINVSSLRPKHAYVKGVNGRSSGAVSWGELYSSGTGLIEQGGSRRGALMLILNDWHPDLPDFINAKREAGKITNANISVGVSDAFMKAVEEDADWQLVFPDTVDPDYDATWDGDLAAWKAKGKPVVVHKTLKAREVWNQIIESAWASAEPGCFFIDRYNAMSNSWYYAPIFCTNPCGEQGLPAWGVCNLGAIHLAKFVTPEREVLWEDLGRAVRYGIRFLDNVIDATPYFFEENAAQQQGERRVGLGTMGLGEMLIRLGIRYGSAESEQFIDKLYEFIASEAYLASAEYAAEKGAFPKFDAEKLLQSGYMQAMPDRVRSAVREQGLRNVTLLTQAPTGTTGTMMDTSTGIEPYVDWNYTRDSRLGKHEVIVPLVVEWKEQHPGEELPDYFVAAMDLTPEEHVRVEAAIQRWTDSSISKTAILPEDYTVEQTREFFELMYRLGCKGGTVYRDSSRNEQILTPKRSKSTGAAGEAAVVLHAQPGVVAEGHDRVPVRRERLPDERPSMTHKFQVGEQEGYITVGVYEDGRPGEVFLRVSQQGSTVSGLLEALGLLTSTALQYGVPVAELVTKMRNFSFEPYGLTSNREIPTASSLVDYIFRYLEKKFVIGKQPRLDVVPGQDEFKQQRDVLPLAKLESATQRFLSGRACPCGALMYHAEGCLICRRCGYTKC